MDFQELVQAEREKQNEKWGEQNHDPYKWMSILGEEIGELNKGFLETENIRGIRFKADYFLETELIQCAAVLKAMYESGKRNGWL
uniref:Uncharacterized protein n=1 Tax=viral metagenome TaxID=1070528 RepID=A0A6M3LRM6_9ZZZZ